MNDKCMFSDISMNQSNEVRTNNQKSYIEGDKHIKIQMNKNDNTLGMSD